MRILTDLDPMPFGKYRGTPLQDVPADYLFWLWDSGMKSKVKTEPVADYIARSISALKKEQPDKIWT
jgi:hypothetical protein